MTGQIPARHRSATSFGPVYDQNSVMEFSLSFAIRTSVNAKDVNAILIRSGVDMARQHRPCSRVRWTADTSVQNDTRVGHPCSRPVNTSDPQRSVLYVEYTHLLSEAVVPLDGSYTTGSVTPGRCDARRNDYFPAAEHCHCPLVGTRFQSR